MNTQEVTTVAKPLGPPVITEHNSPAYNGAGSAPPYLFTTKVASPTTYPYPIFWGNQPIQSCDNPLLFHAPYHREGQHTTPNVQMGSSVAIQAVEGRGPGEMEDPKEECNRISENMGLGCGDLRHNEKPLVSTDAGDCASNRSAESGNKVSSDAMGSNSVQETLKIQKRKYDQMQPDCSPVSVPEKLDATIPISELNVKENLALHVSTDIGVDCRDFCQDLKPKQRIQEDDRDLKKERRKQSNRESAKRSRLRKQQEYIRLQEIIDALKDETNELANNLRNLAEDCEDLRHENDELLEELRGACGSDVISALEARNPSGGKSSDGAGTDE